MNYKAKILFSLFVLFLSCNQSDEKKTSYPDTQIIGHRGSGVASVSGYQENSLASIQNAFEKLDGTHVDLQSSKDGTLWLYNPVSLPENDQDLTCIPGSTDEQLRALMAQKEGFSLTTLREVFELMAQMPVIPHLSLHVIGYFPNGCFEHDNAPRYYFDQMAEALELLFEQYPFQHHVITETAYVYFLDLLMERELDINCYLFGYEDFRKQLEVALEKSYQGISFNFRDAYLTREDVELARQNDIQTMLWNLGNEEDLKVALSWNPMFIRTGNVQTAVEYLQKNQHP